MRADCCEACAWLTERTGCTNKPFDEAIVLCRVRHLQPGDVLRSMRKIPSLGRHALGRVLTVTPEGRRKLVAVQWEDEKDPRRVLSEGARSMLIMVREGDDRGYPGTKHGVWGTVAYRDVQAPWEGLTA